MLYFIILLYKLSTKTVNVLVVHLINNSNYLIFSIFVLKHKRQKAMLYIIESDFLTIRKKVNRY